MTKQLTAMGIRSYGTSGPRREGQPIVLSSVITDGPAGTIGRSLTVEVTAQSLLATLPGLARYALLSVYPELAEATAAGYWTGKMVEEAIKTAVEDGIATAVSEAQKVARS